MGLQVYRRKRKFDVTPEPRGRTARAKGNAFVIQKHAARRLHYDLRLELDGVMKSWAVTRGPSLVPDDKRLAVEVEDHPIEYNAFEGTIPEGEYGGGTVLIWDRGHWVPEGDPHYGLKKGHLEFTLDGEKLHGRWHLVRMHRRPNEKRDNWLLIKAHDEAARDANGPDIIEEMPNSVVSGRSIEEIAQGKGKARVWHSNKNVAENVKAGATRGNGASAAKRNAARSPRRAAADKPEASKSTSKLKAKSKAAQGPLSPLPDFVPPALASLRSSAPSGRGWVHEIKFDGYRIQARLDRSEVRLLTRKGLDWTSKFGSVAEAVAALPVVTALIDGEIVVENGRGAPDFAMLQAALKDGAGDRFVYYAFDLIHRDGRDLAALPLIERKAELKLLLDAGEAAGGTLRYSEHFEADGAQVLAQACSMSLEGIVSKQVDAPYRSGRTDAFIKAKCENAQEFVVGGYVPSTVMARAIGALAVGYYEDGRLIYAGRIGTGYTQATAKELWKRLHALETSRTPFDHIPSTEKRRDVTWVEPRMVIEAHFGGWTTDGLVRQAAFKGVREDKPAKEVVRERPSGTESDEPASEAATHPTKIAAKAAKMMVRKSDGRTRRAAPTSRRAAITPPAGSSNESAVKFTHPERVYWADVGVTKRDLADYYRAVWDAMAPQVVGRPLALLRCPEGTAGQCFFQKHASAGLDDKHLRAIIDGKGRQVIALDDLDGLMALVQAGVLELHVRGAPIDKLDACDRIVFDLDPGEDVGWRDMVAAARDVRERLAALDLESFVKLSGGKGLHVVLPVVGTDWDTVKTFTQALAMAMAADAPERYVAKMTKSLRGGKIFIDYLRNSLEQTSVAAYSTRARAGAPVSVPVGWQELARTTAANQFTVLNLAKRLASLKQDPWQDIARVKQKLPNLQTLRKRG
jgi:bifunctional non-homologous end joining protein LigD